MYKRLKLVQV